MSDIDINVSNGTCYWSANARTKDDFIPCGNVAIGSDYACCQAGDKCLGSNACYNLEYGTTYLIGCTDSEYSAPSCPQKGEYSSQQVVGLTRCDPDKELWAGCEETDDSSEVEPGDSKCTCDGDGLFRADSTLSDVAILPTSLGESISWYEGKTPASASPRTITRSTTIDSTSTYLMTSTSSVVPSPTSSQDSSSSSSSLTPGAKAGIAIGSIAGAAILACIVYLLLRRRGRRREQEEEKHDEHRNGAPSGGISSPFLSADASYAENSAYSGFKSELPANEAVLGPAHRHEMPSDSVPNTQLEPKVYHAYNPDVHGDLGRYSTISDLSNSSSRASPALISPQSTGRDSMTAVAPGGTPRTQMERISELQG
ncbi:hypothetical protein F5Y15DRAFT_14491 [Xylariaceae sp. FL0016]|nr:hypothetical protein F5Y15DRAFT_14491 [Xylariaceae sp. FL0016]